MTLSPAKYALCSLAGLLLSGSIAASAQTFDLDLPEPGTRAFYLYTSEADNYRGFEDVTVLAVGDDFTINRVRYEANPFASSPDDEFYYAEFSGLKIVDCNEDMPTNEERAKLNALWPLSIGDEGRIALYEDEIDTEFVVETSDPVYVSKQSYETYAITITSLTEGTVEEVKTSPELGIYLSLNYEGGETVQVLSVSQPKTPVKMTPEIAASIGTCASLLNE